MNIWDIIILCGVVALVILAIRLYRGRRKSGGCCGGSGDSCRGGSNSSCKDRSGRSFGADPGAGAVDALGGSCSGNCSACRQLAKLKQYDESLVPSKKESKND